MILDKELCKCKYLCNVILLVGFWECPTPGSLSINSSSRILVWIALKMVFITLGPASEYKFMFLLDLEIIVKLRRGSGKDRQGMALKAKGLKA